MQLNSKGKIKVFCRNFSKVKCLISNTYPLKINNTQMSYFKILGYHTRCQTQLESSGKEKKRKIFTIKQMLRSVRSYGNFGAVQT